MGDSPVTGANGDDSSGPSGRSKKLSIVWRFVLATSAVVGLVAGGIAISQFIDDQVPEPLVLACGSLAQDERVTPLWGPERSVYTMEAPAPFATLNSIIDNPNYGDERTFFDVKDSRFDEAGGFCNSKEVRDGDILLFRFYAANSAADDLDDAAAEAVTISIDSQADAASLQTVTATINSTTTTPTEVQSTVELVAPYPIRLDYVTGSSVLYTNAHPTGLPLEDLWNREARLGYDDLDGILQAGNEYAVIGTFNVRITRVESG